MRRESWLPALPEGVPKARAIVRDLASELRLDRATTWELMLATTEAVSNAVEQGRDSDQRGILLRAEIRDGKLGVEVADCGRFAAGCGSGKRRGEGGRGLGLIAAVMDQYEVVPDRGATRVRFAKQLTLA